MSQKTANKAWRNASYAVKTIISSTLRSVQKDVAARAYKASNELRTASLYVLRGERSGRVYKVSGTSGKLRNAKELREDYGHKLRGGKLYRASAPGEAPAVRTGMLRLSWGTHVRVDHNGKTFRAVSAIESNLKSGKYLIGEMLEEGTKHMDQRPYKQAVRNRALPKIREIYNKPYHI